MRAHREGLTPGPEMTKALKTYKFKVIVEFQQLINYLDCVIKLFCLVEMFYWLYCFIFLSFEANTYCSDLIILLNFKPKITRAPLSKFGFVETCGMMSRPLVLCLKFSCLGDNWPFF